MVASLREAPKAKRPSQVAILDHLVREVVNGVPFYYPDYQSVINKIKTLEAVMSDSGLQMLLKEYLRDLLSKGLDRKKYRVWSGETGNHLGLRNNFCLDVAVFDKAVLTPEKITNEFVDVPATLVVEVDVNVALPDKSADLFMEFVVPKVTQLFLFGTEKVVWIFTKSRKVLVAEPNKPWQFHDWNEEIALMDGIKCNVLQYLEEEGIGLY